MHSRERWLLPLTMKEKNYELSVTKKHRITLSTHRLGTMLFLDKRLCNKFDHGAG